MTVRTPENVNPVRESVGRNPKKSIQRCSQGLGISCSTLRRILLKDFQLYPYRIQNKHQLIAADMRKPVVLYQWFDEKFKEDPDFLETVWFSDEAHFLLSSHVNRRNSVLWSTQSPDKELQRPLHTVWVAILKHSIIGPFWLKDDDSNAVMVTKERYIEVFNKFLGDLEFTVM